MSFHAGSSSNGHSSSSNHLSEEYIQDSFHSYLKSSLTQAKAERLLDADVLANAEADLMITGPALCLYFAALRCTTNPPSVPLPRSRKNTTPTSPTFNQPHELSYENCPPAFISFLRVWANTVPAIQALLPEAQHDLARVICGLEPLTYSAEVQGIAADMRAVAIEISQRRSFQDRYADDLQAALDSGAGDASAIGNRSAVNNTRSGSTSPRMGRKTSFVPPPIYSPPDYDAGSTPRHEMDTIPETVQVRREGSRHTRVSPPSVSMPNPYSPPRTPSISTSSARPEQEPSPALTFIRETLYASLYDVLSSQPSLRLLLKRDRTRAYFAAVAFAILHVATTCVVREPATDEDVVEGVLGQRLSVTLCPAELKPFMRELVDIGKEARMIEEEDNALIIKMIQEGGDGNMPMPRLERVKKMLEEGVGYELGVAREGNRPPGSASISEGLRNQNQNQPTSSPRHRRSIEGRAVAFANRINGLSLGMTKLKAFREREGEVFKVLGGV